VLTAPDTALALETEFGDPFDRDNALGFAAILEADERGEMLAAGEAALDRHGLNAEFVPTELGGRLSAVDGLVRALRPVMRRDATLGLGYGLTSFMAAVNVWTAGSDEQREHVARTLLSGAKVAVAYHELDHGNDFTRNELHGVLAGDTIELHGAKQVINNVERAAALLVFVRTDSRPGSRSHSVILLDKAEVDPDRLRYLARYRTVGVRGCQLGGVDLAGCAVPVGRVVGVLGQGAEIALRSFQVTRAALPGIALGVLDTALRTVLRFARGRSLYGTTVADLPHAQATLAGVFVDLLTCDAMAGAAARALHVVPEQAGVLAAATKYLVPRILGEALYELSVILGARFYLREGEHAIFQKLTRDAPVLALGHAGAGACLATLLPQLSGLARRAWTEDVDAPDALFSTDAELPALAPERLMLGTPRRDSMMCAIEPALAQLQSACPGSPVVLEAAGALREARRRLALDCAGLRPEDRTSFGDPQGFELAHEYAVLAAVSALVNTWLRRHHDGHPFLGDPAWVLAGLSRLTRRLTGACLEPGGRVQERLWHELVGREDRLTSFDLHELPLYGSHNAQ
jgi:alkylation response protein AidB-like acyl-CoA dehydrogenase